MPAEKNPYRMRDTEGHFEAAMFVPPEPPPDRGHGLTAEDLNAIAVNAHRRGYAAARREFERPGQARLEQAYDEGHDAASDAMVRRCADNVRRRVLSDVQFRLLEAAHGPKVKLPERVAAAREELSKLVEYLADVAAGREPGL